MLEELEMIENLKNAYGSSTHKENLFKQAIESVKWDDTFKTVDDTKVFIKNNVSLEVHSLDAFDPIRPSVLIGNEIIFF